MKHVKLTEETERDDLGRCRFELAWTDAYGHPRAQMFFADPDERAAVLAEAGIRVERRRLVALAI